MNLVVAGQLVRQAASLNRLALEQVLAVFDEDDRPYEGYCSLILEDQEPGRPEAEVYNPNHSRYVVTLLIEDCDSYRDDEEIVAKYGDRLAALGIDVVRAITIDEGTNTNWKPQSKVWMGSCCEAAHRIERIPGDAPTLVGYNCPIHGISMKP